MSAPKQRRPIERPTASAMVDVLLGDGTEVEVAVVVLVLVSETLDVVTVEEASAEASSLRRTLIQSKLDSSTAEKLIRDNAPKIIHIEECPVGIIVRESQRMLPRYKSSF